MRRLPALLLSLTACGRLGFDARATGDDHPMSDGSGSDPRDATLDGAPADCTPAESTMPSVFGRTMIATPEGWAMPAGKTLFTLAADGTTLVAHDAAVAFPGANNKQQAAADGDLVVAYDFSSTSLAWMHLDGTLDHVGPALTGVTPKDTDTALAALPTGFAVLGSRVFQGPMDYAETDATGAQTFAFATGQLATSIAVAVAPSAGETVALWTQTPATGPAIDTAVTFGTVAPPPETDLPGGGNDIGDDLAGDGSNVLAVTDQGLFRVVGVGFEPISLGTTAGAPTSVAATGDGFDVAVLAAGSSPATVTLVHLSPQLAITGSAVAISVPFVSKLGFNPPSVAGGFHRSLLAFQFSADDAAQVTRLIQSCH